MIDYIISKDMVQPPRDRKLRDFIEALGEQLEIEGRDQMTANQLQEGIEGSLSVKNSLKLLGSTTEDQRRVYSYLLSWIDGARLEDLKKFVKFTTGSPALGKDKPIQITFTNATQMPVSHTCSYNFVLSSQCNSQDEFNRQMEIAIAHSEDFGLV